MDEIDELLMANEVIRDLEILEELNNQPRRQYHVRGEAFHQQLTDAQFIKIFRLTEKVIQMLTPSMEPPTRQTELTIEAKVLAALNFYGTGSYQNPIRRNSYIAISQPSVSRCLEEVTNALTNDGIINRWIRFPHNLDELRTLRTRFYQKYQIPGVVGCIDCTHIAIVPPQGETFMLTGKTFIL